MSNTNITKYTYSKRNENIRKTICISYFIKTKEDVFWGTSTIKYVLSY